MGLLFREGTPNMWHGEDKKSAVKQIVSGCVAWDKDLDWLVVDTPPTGGDEVRSLFQYIPNLYGSIIVTQPNDLSLLGITRTLNMLRELDSPASGILANMAGYRCPHCGQWSNPFDRETQEVRTLAQEYRVPYLGDVPFGSSAPRA